MTATAPSTEALLAAFPHESLPKIVGKPDFDSLTSLRRLLCANAASVHSLLGGGAHGHLGMVLSVPSYQTLVPGTPYDPPVFPGAIPTHAPGATAAVRSDTNATFTSDLRTYREYHALQAALRKQLLAAVDPVYLKALRDNTVGFANVTIRRMLEYLFLHHGTITPLQLQEKINTLDSPWEPDTELADLFKSFEDVREFALAGDIALTNAQLLMAAYTAIYKSGLYFTDLEKWDDKPAANKTWANFQTFFTAAQHKLQARQRTAGSAGYHGAHAMVAQLEAAELHAQQLAAAAQHDRTNNLATMRALTNTITELSTQVRLLTQQLATKDNTILQLRQHQPSPPDAATIVTNNRRRLPKDNGSYCWTHGYCVHRDHSSATCTNKAAGHQIGATKQNTMGGSIRYKEHCPI